MISATAAAVGPVQCLCSMNAGMDWMMTPGVGANQRPKSALSQMMLFTLIPTLQVQEFSDVYRLKIFTSFNLTADSSCLDIASMHQIYEANSE